MCIKTKAKEETHRRLANHLAVYVSAYIENSKSVEYFKQYYDILQQIQQGAKIQEENMLSYIYDLQKVSYQNRYKKGHFYQFNYVVSSMVLTVFKVYSKNKYKEYDYTQFKNYFNYQVCPFTIFKGIDPIVKLAIATGNVIDFDNIKNKQDSKSSIYEHAEYL